LEPTAKLLRRLLVGYVPIKIEGFVNAEGDVVFRVGFQDLKTTLADSRACWEMTFIIGRAASPPQKIIPTSGWDES
jgi:hypothetical protein